MTFEIYIPSSLTFQDYIAVCQCARTFADGYDRKDKTRLRAALAPSVIVDYNKVLPHVTRETYEADHFVETWLNPTNLGNKALATQHLLGVPYFKFASEEKVVVQWQQLASHGRWVDGQEETYPVKRKIDETSDGRSWMQQTYVKVDGQWRIQVLEPEVLYHTGDFQRIRRPEEKGEGRV
ncbi:hypothetical protein ASPTUDRAFT_38300 [Aspergillus tubingensis CBS 134.48]|uniref:Scytalone dehydratase-like domain-containing protein n=1 Tax=Aspergillus tubingensis (strain CBS 134.48) TaxID=767770 RepID=A0A1L9NQ29_ASPTC|nr:hypothetical protein ASPTUDRAFT_38300 [Aspergillus tubingensis CBS 134.48]